MSFDEVLKELDAEIQRLTEARALLAGTRTSKTRGRPAGTRRTLSPEARARIAAAQKRRWAKQRKAQ